MLRLEHRAVGHLEVRVHGALHEVVLVDLALEALLAEDLTEAPLTMFLSLEVEVHFHALNVFHFQWVIFLSRESVILGPT